MVLGWAKVPHVNPSQRPQTAYVSIFIDSGFTSKWGQGVPVPIVWSVEDLIHQFCPVNLWCMQQIERALDLQCKPILQLEWKIAVSCRQRWNEGIFGRLYHTLSHVDVMVVGLDKL